MPRKGIQQAEEALGDDWTPIKEIQEILKRDDKQQLLEQLHDTSVHWATGPKGMATLSTVRGADFIESDGSCKAKRKKLRGACEKVNAALRAVCDPRQESEYEVHSGRLLINPKGQLRLVIDTTRTGMAAAWDRISKIPSTSNKSFDVRSLDFNVIDPDDLALPQTADELMEMCNEHLTAEQGLVVLYRMHRANTISGPEIGDCLAYLFPDERQLKQLGHQGKKILAALFWPLTRIHSGCRWLAGSELLSVDYTDLRYWLAQVRGEIPSPPTHSAVFQRLLDDPRWEKVTDSQWIMVITAARRLTRRLDKEKNFLESQGYMHKQRLGQYWAGDELDWIAAGSAAMALREGDTEAARRYAGLPPDTDVTMDTMLKVIRQQWTDAKGFLEQERTRIGHHPDATKVIAAETEGEVTVDQKSQALVPVSGNQPNLIELFNTRGWVDKETGDVVGPGVVVLQKLVLNTHLSFESADVRACLNMVLAKKGGALKITSEGGRAFADLFMEQFDEVHNYFLRTKEARAARAQTTELAKQSPQMLFLGTLYDILQQYLLEESPVDHEAGDEDGISQFDLFIKFVLESRMREVPSRILHKLLASHSTTSIPIYFGDLGVGLPAEDSFRRILDHSSSLWHQTEVEASGMARLRELVADISEQEKDPFAREAIWKLLDRYWPDCAGMFADAAQSRRSAKFDSRE